MTGAPALKFLLDVDNTLIDSDGIVADFRSHLATALGESSQQHYWKIVEGLRKELGYADYLGALQRYRCENPRDRHFLKLSLFLLDYPFADRLFPKALDVIDDLSHRGGVAIVSNGDVVFQPRKIERSGLYDAVIGHVVIHIHKERDWEDIEHQFPARGYVVIDDEPQILDAAKQYWKSRALTIFVRRGEVARKNEHKPTSHQPDLTIDALAELLEPGHRRLLDSLV